MHMRAYLHSSQLKGGKIKVAHGGTILTQQSLHIFMHAHTQGRYTVIGFFTSISQDTNLH